MDTEKKMIFKKADRQFPKAGDWVKRNMRSCSGHTMFEWKEDYVNHWSDEVYEMTEETSVWKPEKGERYYYIDMGGSSISVNLATFYNNVLDLSRANFGNVFKTNDSALKVAKDIEQLLKGNTLSMGMGNVKGKGWTDEDMIKFGQLIYKNMSYGNISEHDKYVRDTFICWREH